MAVQEERGRRRMAQRRPLRRRGAGRCVSPSAGGPAPPEDRPGPAGEARHPRTLQPPAQLPGEQEHGQLALAVGRLRVVLPPLPVQVLEVYVARNVRQGREVDDA